MSATKTTQRAGKPATFLGSRFRFHAVAALLRQQYGHQSARPLRIKLAFDERRPETPYCPSCRDSELRVYRRALDDEWGCCPECGFATDPVGLIAWELRCTPQEAVEYLVFQHNLYRIPQTEIDEFLLHRARYERVDALLQERLHVDYSLRNHIPEHGLNPNSLHHLLTTLDLRQSLGGEPDVEVSLTRPDRYRYVISEHAAGDTDPRTADSFPFWQQRPNMFQGLFGIVDHMTVESWFYPNLYDELSGRIRPNTSPARLFHGPGWGLVLIIPLQDIPGHFCGILCIGRNGNYPQDYVIRLFSDFGKGTNDTGFILPPRAFRSICRSEEHGKGQLIAYNNPLHLIHTHLHYREMPDLPLIGWIDDFASLPQYHTVDWSPFRNVRDKTFWMQSHQSWTVRTAIEQDAKIMRYDPFRAYPNDVERGIKGVPVFRPTWTALENMPSDALHWPVYLDRHLKTVPPELAAEELKQITFTPQRFETCIAQLPRSNTLRQAALRQPTHCQVKVGQYDIFEEAAGIFRKTLRQNVPVFVTDAKCFLDHVYFTARHVRKIYRGRIIFEGKTVSFDSPVNVFDKDPIGILCQMVRKAGLPEPIFRCKNRFFRNMVLAMSPLKSVETIASVGWSGRTRMLEFPQFQLSGAQGVIPKPERAKILNDDFPAKYQEPPDLTESSQQIPHEERKTTIHYVEYLIPFLTACTLPIIVPTMDRDSSPVFVSGETIDNLKATADCLGIPVAPLENDADMKKIVKHCKQHRWPILTTCRSEPDIREVNRLHAANIRSAIILLDNRELLVKAARYNSAIVHVPMPRAAEPTEPNWQVLTPFLKTLFFGRLREHLEHPPKHESPRSFLDAEVRYWNQRLMKFRIDS